MSLDREKMHKLLQGLIGSKMELGIANGLYKGNYASRLEDLSSLDDGGLLLGAAHPMFKGALLPMSRNLELNLRIESSGYFYQGEAEIVRYVLSGPVPLLWLTLKTPLEKVQRRMFVRVPCSIRGRAFLLEADPGENAAPGDDVPPAVLPERRWFPLMLRDISLGGVGVVFRKAEVPFAREQGRYLLQVAVGGTEFFLICRLIKVFNVDAEGDVGVGMAYEGLPAFTEKLMGGFIRQQELSTRGA